jgi:hypothetical protein
MSIVAALYAEFKRLEEELQHPGRGKKWDEKKHHYYSYLRTIFHKPKISKMTDISDERQEKFFQIIFGHSLVVKCSG